MVDATQLLQQIEAGDAAAAEQLLPVVYQELRCLAAARLANEKKGHTLQATALVHEAYLRLVGGDTPRQFQGRTHFFAAAAEAMRRILIDGARRKAAEKRGGEQHRVEWDPAMAMVERPEEVLAVHESLDALAAADPTAAELVKLHYFGGFAIPEAGELLGLSRATAYRLWTYARAWLKAALTECE